MLKYHCLFLAKKNNPSRFKEMCNRFVVPCLWIIWTPNLLHARVTVENGTLVEQLPELLRGKSHILYIKEVSSSNSYWNLWFLLITKHWTVNVRNIAQNIYDLYGSSHQKCSVKKGVLKNFAKFTGKHRSQSLFLNKVAGSTPATLLKKRLWHRCFPVNFAKFLRMSMLLNE